ncbi:MAG TPA: TIGR03118 family protein [Streptosporangiaceae bacterium]|nr:TIGR03118 family protein [Streptosporangiaceae bacterium]
MRKTHSRTEREPAMTPTRRRTSLSLVVRWGTVAVASVGALTLAVAVMPAGAASIHHAANRYTQTNLISNRGDQGAQVMDGNLLNPWGLAFGPTTPLWVADNNAGVATVYSVNPGGTSVTKRNLTVALPGGRASTGDGPSPTGQVFNATSGFVVTSTAGSGPALFIFSAEAGQISAWNPAADPITNGASTAQVVFSSPTAVYKGLAIATTDAGTFLYATNFHDGTVDVFDSSFHQAHLFGDFRDRHIPAGYAPFGIQEIDGLIYVTYAKQNAQKHDDVAGPGHGFIDIFTTDGLLVKRLASRGALNSPWGLARAPAGFGRFAGQLIVGDFGDGRINAFGQFSGQFSGQLRNTLGKPITIDGLWGLKFGTATTGGTTTLLFSAGINGEKDGLVGSINAAP